MDPVLPNRIGEPAPLQEDLQIKEQEGSGGVWSLAVMDVIRKYLPVSVNTIGLAELTTVASPAEKERLQALHQDMLTASPLEAGAPESKGQGLLAQLIDMIVELITLGLVSSVKKGDLPSVDVVDSEAFRSASAFFAHQHFKEIMDILRDTSAETLRNNISGQLKERLEPESYDFENLALAIYTGLLQGVYIPEFLDGEAVKGKGEEPKEDE